MIRDDVYVYIGEIMQRQGCALSLGIRHFRNRASPPSEEVEGFGARCSLHICRRLR